MVAIQTYRRKALTPRYGRRFIRKVQNTDVFNHTRYDEHERRNQVVVHRLKIGNSR